MNNKIEDLFQLITVYINKLDFKVKSVLEKEDKTFVTQMDLEIENEIIKFINNYFPGHNIISEERGIINNNSEYSWVVDPIDGTHNFIEGKKEYSFSLGLMHKNSFVASLVIFPAINEVYKAICKKTYVNGKPLYNLTDIQSKPDILLCSKSINNYDSLNSKGFSVKCFKCATYSIRNVFLGQALFFSTINTKIYDVGPMAYFLECFDVKPIDIRGEKINYLPNLSTIPSFISTRDTEIVKILL